MSPGSRNNTGSEEQDRLAARRSALFVRAKTLQGIRRFFIERDYLEVETPYLIPAPAPETHIDAFPVEKNYLHTSPELCMKRLLSAGYPKIFQISKCFRQGERGSFHLPEFTMLEWYRTGTDYFGLMEECEEMILSLSSDLKFGNSFSYQEEEIRLKRPWNRISLKDAFNRFTTTTLDEALTSGRLDELIVEQIEPRLKTPTPTFLYDYPASHAALSRLKNDNPSLAERFELYIGGLEVANAFSELTDADEQALRFEKEQQKRQKLGKTVYPMPKKFLKALRYMPQSAGIALGVDRLVLLFANKTSIDEVTAFTPEEV
jgi:lysyl-tRNA synthetase class 2